jgi:uncharacterized membrane protein
VKADFAKSGAFLSGLNLLARAGPLVIGLVLLVSAAAKIYGLDHFSWIATTFVVVPERARQWLIFFVPLSEILVGCALLIPAGRQFALVACIVMLSSYTVFLAVLLGDRAMPSCNCFGTLQLFRDARASNWFGICRNIILIGWALLALLRKQIKKTPATVRSTSDELHGTPFPT